MYFTDKDIKMVEPKGGKYIMPQDGEHKRKRTSSFKNSRDFVVTENP